MKIQPLHDRVIVKRIEEEETTKGGIIIPDTAKEKPQEGIVVAVGSGKTEDGKKIPLEVKKGDRIVTSGGIYGDIQNVKQSTVILRVADSVKIEIQRSSIGAVVTAADDEVEESSPEDES